MDRNYRRAVALVKSIYLSILLILIALIVFMGCYILFFIPRGTGTIDAYEYKQTDNCRVCSEENFNYKIEEFVNDEKEFEERIILTSYTGDDENVEIPSKIDDIKVYKIGNSCFNSNTHINSVTIPLGITEIGTFAFYSCSSMESVTFPGGDSLIIGDSAFRDCKKLNNISFLTSNLIIKQAAFSGCSSLDTVKFVNKCKVVVNEVAFYGTGITQKMMPYGAELNGDRIFIKASDVRVTGTGSAGHTGGTSVSTTAEDISGDTEEPVTEEYTDNFTYDGAEASTDIVPESETEQETETTRRSIFREWFRWG